MNTMAETGIDVVGSLTPIMEGAMGQIVSMITALVPFMITVALFGAGIYLVKKFISTGTKAL